MYKTIETEGWKVSNPFKVATSVSMLDIVTDDDEEREEERLQALYDEQRAILKERGFDYYGTYLLKNRKGYWYGDIDDAIECLALKDGADLVEFESGNLGYIGYYHGFDENWFEIVSTKSVSEHCDMIDETTIAVYEDGLTWVYKITNKEDVDKAVKLIEFAISAWYDTENYPDYESICIGDVIDIQFVETGIHYTEVETCYREEQL